MENTLFLELICSASNFNQAIRQFKRNKRCAGVYRLSIKATLDALGQSDNGDEFRQSLLD